MLTTKNDFVKQRIYKVLLSVASHFLYHLKKGKNKRFNKRLKMKRLVSVSEPVEVFRKRKDGFSNNPTYQFLSCSFCCSLAHLAVSLVSLLKCWLPLVRRMKSVTQFWAKNSFQRPSGYICAKSPIIPTADLETLSFEDNCGSVYTDIRNCAI